MNEKYYETKGTLRYNPKMLGEHGGEWWLVIDLDDQISAYYRKLYEMYFSNRPKLLEKTQLIQAPFWKAHVSVIKRDEPPKNKKYLWNKYQGEQIMLSYSHEVSQWGPYLACEVKCEKALDIREELGLKRHPWNKLHMTIGNKKNIGKLL